MLNIQKSFIKHITPKALGYQHSNGVINFQTTESATNYAKNRILRGLKQNKEVCVITNDTRVLKCIDGQKHSVSARLRDFPHSAGATVAHGHPDNYKNETNPFSTVDIKTFLLLNRLYKYKKVIVYNSLGEECSLSTKVEKANKFLNKVPLFLKNTVRILDMEYKSKIIDKILQQYSPKMQFRGIEISRVLLPKPE